MMNDRTCILAAVAGVLSAGSVWAADTDLQQQVNELRGQVAQLEQREAASSKEVAATIESVLRDAEKRSQIMAAGDSGAGYDDGFFIKSGAFVLKPGVLFQFRNITDYRDNTPVKGNQIENGFEVSRLELSLNGTAFTKDLTYSFMWKTASEGGGVSLLDAYVNYMFCDAWGITAGQQTANFTHEDFLGDGVQLAVDRSLLDAVLGGYTNRIQGMGILYGNYNEKNPLNGVLMLHDGSNSLNSNYVGHYPSDPEMAPGNHTYDFGVLARVEYKAMGSWDNYSDFTAKGVKDNLLVIGAGCNWDQGGNGDVLGFTADAQFKMNNGLALYGGVVYRYTNAAMAGDAATAAGHSDQNDWGFIIQGSYLWNPAWEIFARYALVKFDTAVVMGADTENTFHEISVGVNYYLGNNGSAGHRAQVTVDLDWLPNGAPMSLTGIGYLGDSNFDTELVVRGQFQLTL
ncbi:MAG: porin [Tepidisphaeraceae bacterium]